MNRHSPRYAEVPTVDRSAAQEAVSRRGAGRYRPSDLSSVRFLSRANRSGTAAQRLSLRAEPHAVRFPATSSARDRSTLEITWPRIEPTSVRRRRLPNLRRGVSSENRRTSLFFSATLFRRDSAAAAAVGLEQSLASPPGSMRFWYGERSTPRRDGPTPRNRYGERLVPPRRNRTY